MTKKDENLTKNKKENLEVEVKATKLIKEPPDTKKAPPKKDKKTSTPTKKVTSKTTSNKASKESVKRTTDKKNDNKVEIESTISKEDLNDNKQLITGIDKDKKPKKEKIPFKQRLKNLWAQYTLYEKIWFITITIASIAIGIAFPEEDTNGVNGGVIMGLYLSNIFLNILCELMIAKQNKWNFIVSLGVELSEIALCLVLKTMFISFLSIIIFWIPIDIISFISWNKHKDEEQEELTVVRELNKKQKLIFVLAVAVWTIGLGYLSATFSPDSDAYSSELNKRIVAYLDAGESSIAIANGLFIMLRFKEQWGTWIIASILEASMNILLGQWVLLVLKAGYLTNSIYGYIKWSKYIKHRNNDKLITDVNQNKDKRKLKTNKEITSE